MTLGTTSSRAASKWSIVMRTLPTDSPTSSGETEPMNSREAAMAASRASASMSAPTKFSVRRAISSRSTSSASGLCRVWTSRIFRRASSSGTGTWTWRSSRPGRSSAESIRSGRLVVAMTTTSSSDSSPSSSVSSWETTRSETPESLWLRPRSVAMESISSKNTTVGAFSRALLNTSRTPFSDSPTNLFSSSGPLMEMKLESASLATAFASRVFPVPGGPYIRTPFAAAMSNWSNTSGYSSGHWMVSRSRSLVSSSPPTSAHVTSGTSTKTSRSAEGSMPFSASLKSFSVTWMDSSTSASISSLSRSRLGRIRRSACIADSLASDSRSAPTKPWVFSAYSSRSIPSVSGMFRV